VTSDLPIEHIVADLRATLDQGRAAVLRAPPGSGKTTVLPLRLRDAGWLAGRRIVVLAPRRLAARAAAHRMAVSLGEQVGETVGYRVRFDARVGPATRIEVVTDGLFLRVIQGDPALERYAAVLFDEFHERRLEADLALALTLETRAALRPDLRLVIMSATLDPGSLLALIPGAVALAAEGRMFPVAVEHAARPIVGRREEAAADRARAALAEDNGDILVFLPGAAEIRRAERRLAAAALPDRVAVSALHGDLPAAAQDAAIAPSAPGRRKIVLASAIAETSLTIEGVTTVIDAGLRRAPRFDPRTGMTRLETMAVSAAGAEQRRGRAGRVRPGRCLRLWTEADHRGLAPFDEPEIRQSDLAALALELAVWGARDPGALAWLDPPPAAAWDQATALLRDLGALDGAGAATAHGRAVAVLGLHPRLGHMVARACADGRLATAAALAALLAERDPLRGDAARRDADLAHRLELLVRPGGGGAADRGALDRIRRAAAQVVRAAGGAPPAGGAPLAGGAIDPALAGALLASAYPDRIARMRDGARGQYRLSSGGGASLDPADPLAGSPWLAVAALDGDRTAARIFLAAALDESEAVRATKAGVVEDRSVAWDDATRAVVCRRIRRLGQIVLADDPLAAPDPAHVQAALVGGIRRAGIGALPWSEAATALRARVLLVAAHDPRGAWPDFSDDALAASLEEWLAPELGGIMRLDELARRDLAAILLRRLDWTQRQRLDILAPSHWTVPSGSRIRIDYAGADRPILAVKVQELFGASRTPAIVDGRLPLRLHLLSPAGRPVQVTDDLPGFWARGWQAVRAELRGRYPKHFWPEEPLTAPATRGPRPR